MDYAIGLKDKIIDNANVKITIPDDNWITVTGKTDDLKQIYDEIYKEGSLLYEIETFKEDGSYMIKYYR